MLKEKIDQMSCSENFKNIMKKFFFALAAFGLAVIVLLNLAACNGDNSDKSPNMPDDNGDTSIEQVQKTVGDILKTFDVTEPSIMDVAKDYVKSGEKLLSAKLNASGDLEMIFESGDNISCKTADLPAGAQTLLSQDWQEYVLDKLGEKSLDKAIVGQDKIDAFKQRVSDAISDYKSAIKALYGAEITLNAFGGGNYDDKGALKKIVKDNLLEYKYNSVREDESFVIIGVDKQGNVIEYLVQMNELAGGDVYKRFVNGIEGVDYTLTRTVLDISERYAQPAEREVVSFDDLYTSVFGKGFVFKPYKEVLEELTDKIFPRDQITIVATGNVDNKYRIYFQNYDAIKRRNLTYIEFVGADNSVIDGLNYLAATANVDDIKDIFSDYKNKKFISETDYITQTKNYLMSIKTNIVDKQKNIENSKKDDWVGRNVFIGTKEQLDFDKFGEQYLNVTGKTDAQLISAFVGAMSGHAMDASNHFDTGYVSYFDLCVMYEDKGSICIYKTNIAVPWYNNSTNESLYNSFLNNVKFKFGVYELNEIENANLLAELPNNNKKEINLNDWKQDIFIEEDKRLA